MDALKGTNIWVLSESAVIVLLLVVLVYVIMKSSR